MTFENSPAFAQQLDKQDLLTHLRDEFLIPKHNGKDAIYLCGNSLGLLPKGTGAEISAQLSKWGSEGVEGWFSGEAPWLEYQQQQLKPVLANLAGAQQNEVAIMNSLTVNLHLLLVSFYQPTPKKFKILMEAGAFPSDQYAIASQVHYHGFDPAESIIEISPREGEYILRTEDIVNTIDQHTDELALVLFGGVNYYTGQLFDLSAITEVAHSAGTYAGFDLAHAIGNVPLNLHDWGVDFACWCSYKYLNSGPGGVSGIFVHERHHGDSDLKRFEGWWGNNRQTQFKMAKHFDAAAGADAWQLSTSPILLLAAHKAGLDVFEKAGGIKKLRIKSLLLTAYLEYLINQINYTQKEELFKVITPADPEARGCQLSIICKRNGRAIFEHLASNGVIGDWREPDVIRLSPMPLYNTFTDIYITGVIMAAGVNADAYTPDLA